MKLEQLQYDLPQELVARIPVEDRESARLLVCSRSDASRLEHRCVRDLPTLLRAGDALVLNDTLVLPHRLVGRRATGGRVECLILTRAGGDCLGFLKPSKRLRSGEILEFESGAIQLEVLESLGGGRHRFRIRTDGEDLDAVLDRVGRAPIPPYIERGDDEDVRADRERYQTVFARVPGAVAAPTAGLHLTEDLLERLGATGIGSVRVTLHVGEGTFEPIRVTDVEDHVMHAECYELSQHAVRSLAATRASGGRVFCVGTTSARVLESCHDEATDSLQAGRGETRLFLYPGRSPSYIDGLLTNFHLPGSTLLLLVASLLGIERTRELYALAIRERYRFYSFGDAMLILP